MLIQGIPKNMKFKKQGHRIQKLETHGMKHFEFLAPSRMEVDQELQHTDVPDETVQITPVVGREALLQVLESLAVLLAFLQELAQDGRL